MNTYIIEIINSTAFALEIGPLTTPIGTIGQRNAIREIEVIADSMEEAIHQANNYLYNWQFYKLKRILKNIEGEE